ncbi:unnamed protein product [Euphydryas editha]|uniref:Uncharacterized protein n=1 Tax=Euphydryas editha TaxID=104508 RepID=A0AAU9VFH6_EUPED|nr:unnamed protein product [Euphydryas editha]
MGDNSEDEDNLLLKILQFTPVERRKQPPLLAQPPAHQSDARRAAHAGTAAAQLLRHVKRKDAKASGKVKRNGWKKGCIPSTLRKFGTGSLAGSRVEQSQTSRSPTSTFINIDQEKMTDSGQRNQPDRSPKNKKSGVSKLFKRVSLSKKQEDELSNPNTPPPERQRASTEGSTTMTHVNISYASVAQPDLSSESYYVAP